MDYLKMICSLAAIAILLAFLFLIKRSEKCKKIEKKEGEKNLADSEESKGDGTSQNEPLDYSSKSKKDN